MLVNPVLEQIRYGLIASCQALPGEPLHGSETMAKMAKAAEEGGAIAIRANSAEDVRAIKQAVSFLSLESSNEIIRIRRYILRPRRKKSMNLLRQGRI